MEAKHRYDHCNWAKRSHDVAMRLLIMFVMAVATFAPASAAISEAGVYFITPAGGLAPNEKLALSYNDGLGWKQGRVRTKAPQGRLYDHRVLPYGKLRVHAVLRGNGITLARAEINVPVEGDRYYDIHTELRPDDPTRSCMGCSKAVSVLIKGKPRDRLWLWYGFNGISNPIIF